MTFGGAIKSCFSNYANFSGRARRSEYWFFYLLYLLQNVYGLFVYYTVLFGALSFATDEKATVGASFAMFIGICIFSMIYLIVMLVLFIPSLSVQVRRLHDIGKSGWNILFFMIPIVGLVPWLVWSCTDSQPGTNKWGKNPKEDDDEPTAAPSQSE